VIGFIEISYFNDSAFRLRHNLLSVIIPSFALVPFRVKGGLGGF